jgi:hypothetical protein
MTWWFSLLNTKRLDSLGPCTWFFKAQQSMKLFFRGKKVIPNY